MCPRKKKKNTPENDQRLEPQKWVVIVDVSPFSVGIFVFGGCKILRVAIFDSLNFHSERSEVYINPAKISHRHLKRHRCQLSNDFDTSGTREVSKKFALQSCSFSTPFIMRDQYRRVNYQYELAIATILDLIK